MSDPPTVARGFARQMMVYQNLYVDTEMYHSFCEAVISCVDAGVMVVSLDGTVLLMNPVMRHMMATGFPDGHEVRAGQVGDVYAEDGVTRLASDQLPSARAVRGEEYSGFVVVLGPPGGQRLTISITARRLRAHDGTGLGIVVVATDITDLSEATAARDRFLATVSHELRTPLTSIMGYLALMLDEQPTLSPQDQAHLEVVRRNTGRLAGLVDQLLQISSASSGVRSRTSTPTDLAELLQQAIESMRPAIAEAGLHLSFQSEPTPPIRTDRDGMADVFNNLLTNAVKYTPRGGHIRAQISVPGDEVAISISDDGPGVPPSDRGRIFDRFVRGAYAEDHAIPGVGLGLSIVRAAVEANGGRVELQTSPAGGADFVVRLPR
jgi:signal transduction histidine kinase